MDFNDIPESDAPPGHATSTDLQTQLLAAGLSPGIAEDIATEGHSPLPIDAGLEVTITPTEPDAFEESHYHDLGGEMVLHLEPGDAHEFDAAVLDNFLRDMMEARLDAGAPLFVGDDE